MEVEVEPTQDCEKLLRNLEREFDNAQMEEDKIILETEDPAKVGRRPGVEEVKAEGEVIEGVGGKPLDEIILAKLETKKDAVRALIATIDGYNLIIKETDRQWDLKNLKDYNPNIKELKGAAEDVDLRINKSLDPEDDLETVEIELGDEWEKIYSSMLT